MQMSMWSFPQSREGFKSTCKKKDVCATSSFDEGSRADTGSEIHFLRGKQRGRERKHAFPLPFRATSLFLTVKRCCK